MRTFMISIVLTVGLCIAAYANCPYHVTCPAHDWDMYATGQYEYRGIHKFQLYRCVGQDEYWVRCD